MHIKRENFIRHNAYKNYVHVCQALSQNYKWYASFHVRNELLTSLNMNITSFSQHACKRFYINSCSIFSFYLSQKPLIIIEVHKSMNGTIYHECPERRPRLSTMKRSQFFFNLFHPMNGISPDNIRQFTPHTISECGIKLKPCKLYRIKLI